jgi:hypothetical protein
MSQAEADQLTTFLPYLFEAMRGTECRREFFPIFLEGIMFAKFSLFVNCHNAIMQYLKVLELAGRHSRRLTQKQGLLPLLSSFC